MKNARQSHTISLVIKVMHTRLLALRKEKHLTQQLLAIDLGIDQSSISSYETGKYLPTVEVLAKYAEYFGVSTDYLLGLTDVKTPVRAALDDQTAYASSLFASLPGSSRERALGYLESLCAVYK